MSLYSHWLWHWAYRHWAKRHRRSGGPAWFCCCGSSVCSSSSGWHRTGPSACYQGSGPSDDPPPPPQALTPPEPVRVTLLQLQPSPDKPAPTGSAGQTALTRQSMGARAAVCTVETKEKKRDWMLEQQLLFLKFEEWLCGWHENDKKNTNLQINSLTPKWSERIREITDTSRKRGRVAFLFVSMSMWHHSTGMLVTPEEHVNICLGRNWWDVMMAWRKHRDGVTHTQNRLISHLKHNRTSTKH